MRTSIFHNIVNWGIVVLLVVVSVQPQLVLANDLPGAVSYINTQVQDDWSAQALVAAGEAVTDQVFADTFDETSATAVEKRILTLVALDKDPRTQYSGRDLVAELQTDLYTDEQIGDVGFINDDMWGVLALAAVHETQSLVFTDSVEFIIQNQNTDGGWSYAVGGESDTNDTAVAIMALLEAGYTATSPEIVDALAYLDAARNEDMGWGFTATSESDSASTAWVISALRKAGQEVMLGITDWLWTLQTSDGSFKWLVSDEAGSLYMTSQAVIALSESYFPVKKQTVVDPVTSTLRIEGSDDTYCTGEFIATTALSIVETAADNCAYTYVIEDTSFGPYLKQIHTDEAAGLAGWLYRVNDAMPAVGAADYNLAGGDEVLWYYGEFDWAPLRAQVNSTLLSVGDTLSVSVEYFDDTDNTWKPAESAVISAFVQTYATDAEGKAEIVMENDGRFELSVEKADHIRSNRIPLVVGDGIAETVGWQVEIESDGAGSGGDPEIAFSVNTDTVDFGKLKKGQASEQQVSISNEGAESIYLEATVTGEPVLTGQVMLNDEKWQVFNQTIATARNEVIDVSMTVPSDYTGVGTYSGDIIFWGTAVQ